MSGIDPVGPLLAEHLEDDAAEVSAEGADGLVVLRATTMPDAVRAASRSAPEPIPEEWPAPGFDIV